MNTYSVPETLCKGLCSPSHTPGGNVPQNTPNIFVFLSLHYVYFCHRLLASQRCHVKIKDMKVAYKRDKGKKLDFQQFSNFLPTCQRDGQDFGIGCQQIPTVNLRHVPIDKRTLRTA